MLRLRGARQEMTKRVKLKVFLKSDSQQPPEAQASLPDANGRNTSCSIGRTGHGVSIVYVGAQLPAHTEPRQTRNASKGVPQECLRLALIIVSWALQKVKSQRMKAHG